MTAPKGATSAHRIAEIERRTQALRYRKAGLSYEQIGAQMSITRQAAYQLVRKSLDSMQAENVESLRTLENERLDDMLRAIYATATKGDTGAIDRILRIMERRAKLWGLDAPVKQDVTSGGERLHHIIEVEIGPSLDGGTVDAQSAPHDDHEAASGVLE
jgi:hypothetical protein